MGSLATDLWFISSFLSLELAVYSGKEEGSGKTFALRLHIYSGERTFREGRYRITSIATSTLSVNPAGG